MINLVKTAHIKCEKLPSSKVAENDFVSARGIIFNQIHYFDSSLLEQIKPEIANYLKEIGINEYSTKTSLFLTHIKKLEDLEKLDIFIATITALDFIQNGVLDTYHNLEAVGNDYKYLTTYAIDYAKINKDSEQELIKKLNEILSKISFFVKFENIKKQTSKQK